MNQTVVTGTQHLENFSMEGTYMVHYDYVHKLFFLL
jgi:hypothetical protein